MKNLSSTVSLVYSNLSDLEISFINALFAENGMVEKFNQEAEKQQSHALDKGYLLEQVKTVLKLEKAVTDSLSLSFVYGGGVQIASNVDEVYNLKTSFCVGQTFDFVHESYSKAVNDLGKKLKLEKEAFLKLHEEEKQRKAIEAKQAYEKEQAEKELKRQSEEATFKAWLDQFGSEKLKTRIELGFDFKCLAMSEYSEWLLGKKITKWEEFDSESNHPINRPSLEQMNLVKNWDAKLKDKVRRCSLFKANGTFINFIVIVPSLGDHDVVVEL